MKNKKHNNKIKFLVFLLLTIFISTSFLGNLNTYTVNGKSRKAKTTSRRKSNKTKVTKSSKNKKVAVKKSASKSIYYWTPKGKSYHSTKNCRTLSRSKVIYEGTLSECPKNDPCDVCN